MGLYIGIMSNYICVILISILIALSYLTIKQTDKTMGKIMSFEYNVLLIIVFMFFYNNLYRYGILLLLLVNPLSLVIEFIAYLINKNK